MEICDKVKLVKGNPFGKIGKIKHVVMMSRPVDLIVNPRGLDGLLERCYSCEADDDTKFSGWEDDLELLNE